MSQVVRAAGTTVVTLLGTIGSTAGAVAKTVDALASSVDMLDSFVQRAVKHQRAAHLVEDHHWQRNLILDAAKAQETIETAIKAEYAGNVERQSDFNKITAELEALFT